jgi:hypothetical protein
VFLWFEVEKIEGSVMGCRSDQEKISWTKELKKEKRGENNIPMKKMMSQSIVESVVDRDEFGCVVVG